MLKPGWMDGWMEKETKSAQIPNFREGEFGYVEKLPEDRIFFHVRIHPLL